MPRVLAPIAIALLAGACFFPSFDKFEERGARPNDDASETPPDDDADPPVALREAGVDAALRDAEAGATRVPDGVRCDDTTCAPGAQYCCVGSVLNGDHCTTKSLGDCAFENFGNARGFRCDGPEDCPAGQVCCFVDSDSVGAACSATCNGAVVCHTTADCAAGTTCAGPIDDDLFERYLRCR